MHAGVRVAFSKFFRNFVYFFIIYHRTQPNLHPAMQISRTPADFPNNIVLDFQSNVFGVLVRRFRQHRFPPSQSGLRYSPLHRGLTGQVCGLRRNRHQVQKQRQKEQDRKDLFHHIP